MKLLKLIAFLSFSLTTFMASAEINVSSQENFHDVLARIQDSRWKGHFKVNGLGPLTNCHGPLDVKFFPLTVEDFSDGIKTVSYRHHADFSHNLNPICRYIAAGLSPVNQGKCSNDTFPMKFNPDENKMVPFRTIIPRDEGQKAFVNSPSCDNKTGIAHRQELELTRATLSDNDNRLDLEIRLRLKGILFRMTYVLERQP